MIVIIYFFHHLDAKHGEKKGIVFIITKKYCLNMSNCNSVMTGDIAYKTQLLDM